MTKFNTQVSKLLAENSKEQPIITVVKSGYRKGNKEWRLKNGNLHREDGPAIEFPDGSKVWIINNKHHREDGPAIERADGYKEWRQNGKLYRKDGPTIEDIDGSKYWFIDYKLHREDGPAIERADGRKEWYLNNEKLSEDIWKARVNIKKNVPPEHQQSVIDILDL